MVIEMYTACNGVIRQISIEMKDWISVFADISTAWYEKTPQRWSDYWVYYINQLSANMLTKTDYYWSTFCKMATTLYILLQKKL